jgi:hypothetical protein
VAISTLPTPAAIRVSHGPTCLVCVALENLSKADATALRGHLANKAWRYTELSDALRADPDTPLDLPPHCLARHARGHCAAREQLR